MARDKFIDFKFITFFRMLFCILTILTFLMPWTYGPERSSGLGTIGPPPPVKANICSGYDFVLGCNPIYDVSLFIQTQYLILIPIILIISLVFMFLQKEGYVIVSMGVNLFSILPMIIWLDDINSKIPSQYLDDVYLTYGIVVFFVLIIVNVIIGFITLKYSEI